MAQIETHQIRQQIEQIIERSRYQDELFLIDSKTAASNILQYLQSENLLSKDDGENK